MSVLSAYVYLSQKKVNSDGEVQENKDPLEIPCVNPRQLMSEGNTQSHCWVNRANSYCCPVHDSYGQGWALVTGKHLKLIDMARPLSMTFYSSPEKERDAETKVIKTLYILRAICVSQSDDVDRKGSLTTPVELREPEDPFWSNTKPTSDNSVYLLELVDVRYFYKKFTLVNKGYNVLCETKQYAFDSHDITSYHQNTLDETDPEEPAEPEKILWSWNTALDDLWEMIPEDMRGELTKLESAEWTDVTPSITNQLINFRTWGLSVWDAVIQMLNRRMANLVYDPETGDFEVISTGVRDENLHDIKKLRELDARRMLDMQVIENEVTLYPETYRKLCPRKQTHSAAPVWDSADDADKNWYASPIKEVGDMGTGDHNTLAGTVEAMFDPDTYDYGDDEVGGMSEVGGEHPNTLAGYVAYQREERRPGRIIYAGIAPYIKPGTELRVVIWRDYGDERFGLVTEVFSHPHQKFQLPSALSYSFNSREVGESMAGMMLDGLGNLGDGYTFMGNTEKHLVPDYNRSPVPNFPSCALIKIIASYNEDPDLEAEPPETALNEGTEEGQNIVFETFAEPVDAHVIFRGVVRHFAYDNTTGNDIVFSDAWDDDENSGAQCRVLVLDWQGRTVTKVPHGYVGVGHYLGNSGEGISSGTNRGFPLFAVQMPAPFTVTITGAGIQTVTGPYGEDIEVTGVGIAGEAYLFPICTGPNAGKWMAIGGQPVS
jgi:hypothetical protein